MPKAPARASAATTWRMMTSLRPGSRTRAAGSQANEGSGGARKDARHAPDPSIGRIGCLVAAPARSFGRAGYMQMPFKQVWLASQLFPHVPQLFLSVVRLAQVVPHLVSSGGQLAAHIPAVH